MKRENIVNSNISFYDILVKGTSSVAAYMRNNNVIEVYKTEQGTSSLTAYMRNKNVEVYKTADYEIQFPIYGSMLKSQFRKGMEWNRIFEAANRCFYSLFNGYTELPYECAEKVLGYLSHEDLKNLIDAFEPHCVSLSHS